MQSNEIRQKFLDFFEKRGHTIIPSASLIPENDPSVLFNTAGMQPLVPYLLGEKHSAGNRIVNVQKCVRTTDIDEVGDNTHLTFFEMLGNWSLGDYFKKEAIQWSYEFLTDKEEGLGLDFSRLYITVFEGDENAPKDKESFEIWKDIFEKAGLDPEKRIFFMSAKSNWWPQPKKDDSYSGPCGSDSEMFYDITGNLTEGMTKEEFIKADGEQKVMEVWNDVFMEYEKKDGKIIGKLKQKNVDTGAGLERLAMIVQNKRNIYLTDLLGNLYNEVKNRSTTSYGDEDDFARIITDHIRAMVFIISDGVIPANTDRGYILRRIIRRAVRYADTLGIQEGGLSELANVVIEQYGEFYENVKNNAEQIKNEIEKEEKKFKQTLKKGLRELKKLSSGLWITNEGEEFHKSVKAKYGKNIGKDFFNLFQTYGFPIEMSLEEINNILNNIGSCFEPLGGDRQNEIRKQFNEEMRKHQELSRTASVGKFKGGLSGYDENSTKLHTATHLLNQALREVLGEHIEQKGSNINSERLRFDFSHSAKMTDEEKQKVEDLVNQKIKENLPVEMEEMTIEKARESGAVGVFGNKYGEKVKVYSIGNFSKEICGGPHVKNTGELGHFKIKKESASSAGVRRIKGILEL